MAKAHPVLGGDEEIAGAEWGAFGGEGAMDPAPFASSGRSFYLTDPISRASPTLALCQASVDGWEQGKTGTDG